MESVLAALKETPIPTILVIAGILFLLLSIAGQLAGRIAVPPERQWQAAIIGGILMVAGIGLHVAPPRWLTPFEPPKVPVPPSSVPPIKRDQLPSTSEAPPSAQSAPSASESTPQPPKVEAIPSLNARLTALRFFEGNPCDEPPLQQRIYKQHFPKAITRDIFTELTLEHSKRERSLFTIQAVYERKAPNAKVVSRPELATYTPADGQRSIHWFRSRQGEVVFCVSGASSLGRWSVGSYTVDVYSNGEKVASGSFEVHD